MKVENVMEMSTRAILLLIIHFLTCVSIGLNIPILRQCFGFVYLTFVPGFVILRVLRLKEKNVVNTFLFSVGLSIAFLMFIGLLINALYPLFGVSNPLSTVPLTVTIISLTLMIFFIGFRQDFIKGMNTDFVAGSNTNTNERARHILFYAFLLLLPVLAVVGALYINTFLLILLIIGIAILYAISIFSGKFVPPKLYPLVILAISTSLLLHTALISKHLMGWDIFAEYSVFKQTENLGYWNALGSSLSLSFVDVMNSVLSVTILPTIYSLVPNLDGELVFKLVYPFIFSLVPLSLYRVFESQSKKSIALISTFFFISNVSSFYGLELLSLARQMIAELFFVLSIFSLINKKMTLQNRTILFMIFSTALVFSHYSVSYIFLFYVVFTFVILRIRGKEGTLKLGLVLFLLATTFSWYMYVSSPPLNRLLESIQHIVDRFTVDIFAPQARLDYATAPLISTAQTSIIGLLHKIVVYISQFFIGIGLVVLVIKPEEFKIDSEFRLMAILSGFLLLLCLAVPNLAPTLNLSRFYSIVILFLALLFTLGGIYFLQLIKRFLSPFLSRFDKVSRKDLELRILTAVLIAFFLFQVGFVNHITEGYPYSYSLDFNRKKTSTDLGLRVSLYSVYVPEQDFFSAQWLRQNKDNEYLVCADGSWGRPILLAYALLNYDKICYLFNATKPEDLFNVTKLEEPEPSCYIYLRHLNVREGLIYTVTGAFNLSDISLLLAQSNKIYSNGDSEIYSVP